VDCGEPRGDKGTTIRCSVHAAAARAKRAEERARRVADERCQYCDAPRAGGGTGKACENCAERSKANTQEWVARKIEQGRCPAHKGELLTLSRCFVCLYEQTDATASRLTFDGLLPAPSSGDKLDRCVRCDSCSRVYHEGSSYYIPQLPAGLKLKDEHVGDPHKGLLVRFTDVNEEGVLVEYKGCSTPERKCTKRVTWEQALLYLQWHRKKKRVPRMCFWHARHSYDLMEAVESRVLQQNNASTQAQNGGGPENGAAKNSSGGRMPKSEAQKRKDLEESLILIQREIQIRKKAGENRSKVTANAVAESLHIGSVGRGGTAMMETAKNRGLAMDWPSLRDHFWDGGQISEVKINSPNS
jgi:hypothetical protein